MAGLSEYVLLSSHGAIFCDEENGLMDSSSFWGLMFRIRGSAVESFVRASSRRPLRRI
jgi:hypothetical protein